MGQMRGANSSGPSSSNRMNRLVATVTIANATISAMESSEERFQHELRHYFSRLAPFTFQHTNFFFARSLHLAVERLI